MDLEYLAWDSDFFGLNIGKIEIYDEISFDPLIFKRMVETKKFDLVYIFKYNSILSSSTVINSKIHLMDIIVQMSKIFEPHHYSGHHSEIRNHFSEKELSECYNIAEQTSMVSRFYREPLIARFKTKMLYRRWIDNAINGIFSDGLFVEKLSGKIIGLHLIKTDKKSNVGHCTLIGVHADSKRIGIGKKLWDQSFHFWSKDKEIKKVVVPVSFQNKESLDFHLNLGFTRFDIINYIYHYRNVSI